MLDDHCHCGACNSFTELGTCKLTKAKVSYFGICEKFMHKGWWRTWCTRDTFEQVGRFVTVILCTIVVTLICAHNPVVFGQGHTSSPQYVKPDLAELSQTSAVLLSKLGSIDDAISSLKEDVANVHKDVLALQEEQAATKAVGGTLIALIGIVNVVMAIIRTSINKRPPGP